jgi:hypothetical protein
MLGKLALKQGDPAAVGWFRKTRDLAGQGFGDSLGMAADSYGWEGRSEWKQGHPQQAAPLFLTQLALGDESAIVSLKALIPDRDEVDGMLNYSDDIPATADDQTGPIKFTDAEIAAMAKKIPADLLVMARDPLLRRLETAHILATESGGAEFNNYNSSATPVRSQRWLAVIQSAKLGTVEDAEYLGWVAYTLGDYKSARHWLDLSSGTTPIAEWLRARLQLRAGDTKGAAASMAAAWNVLRDPGAYPGWNPPDAPNDSSIFVFNGDDGQFTMQQWAGGDMGAVHLLRSDFVQALDTFIKGGLDSDAAYVAERVLTANELKAYVDQMPPSPKPPTGSADDGSPPKDATAWMRYLLGRRLVREDRYTEAADYLPHPYALLLAKYVEALNNGANARLTKSVRADNWSTAAWLARNDGMELMGTEVSPDGFDSSGEFEDTDLVGMRTSGTYSGYEGGNNVTLSLDVPATKSEKQRLAQNKIHPDVRFHYRVIATALALKAAALMDDNTEELADALNKAGAWADNRDDKLANHCYSLIEKRCGKSKLGAQILAKHWFINQDGPWSTALQAQEDALHKQFGIVPEQQ